LLVSVGHTTCQRINYFYVNEPFSTSEHSAYLFGHTTCQRINYFYVNEPFSTSEHSAYL